MSDTLRWKFEVIKMHKDLLKDHPESEKAANYLIELKREARKMIKVEEKSYIRSDGGIILNGGGDYDSRWQKIFYPDEHWTNEEKREYIDCNWIECPNSQYDCTGAIFTWAIDIFDVPKGTVVYIREAIDV